MSCEKCPFKKNRRLRGQGPIGGLMIIGEAPTAQETIKGKPSLGPSGQILRAILNQLDSPLESHYVTHVAECQQPGNKFDTSCISSCTPRLIDEIRMVRPKKLLMCGATAIKAIARHPDLETDYPKGSYSITANRGLGVYVTDKLTGHRMYAVATWHPAIILRDPDLFRDLVDDVTKIVTRDDKIQLPPIREIRIENANELAMYLADLHKQPVVSCDLETTGLSNLDDSILSIGFGNVDAWSVIIPVELINEPDIKAQVVEFIESYEGPLPFHNGKFDYQFLFRYAGRTLFPKKHSDTMLMRYLQDERGYSDEDSKDKRHSPSHGLKTLAQVRYDIPDYHFDWKTFYNTPWEDRDWDSLYKYHAQDCYLTAILYQELYQQLMDEDPDLMTVHDEILAPASLAFAEMGVKGAFIDRPYLEEQRTEFEQKIEAVRNELKAIALVHGMEEFNPGSTFHVKKLFVEVMKLPIPNTEKETLQMARSKLPDDHKHAIDLLLEYRVITKTLSTYINGILSRLDSDDCVRSDFKLNGTATGRLSSANPNLQNIPSLMGPVIKKAFKARPGFVLIEADESQAELRVAGLLAMDTKIIQAYWDGRDIHREVAASMFNKHPSDIDWFERYLAKYVDFGVIYGRQAKSLAEGWEMQYYEERSGKKGWTLEEAQYFLQAFLDDFPDLRDWILYMHAFVKENHYVKTLTGRRRRFPYLDKTTLSAAQRQSVNTVIQSLASDITLTALIRIQNRIREFGGCVIFTVHDSIMMEVPEDKVDESVEIALYEMGVNLPRQIDRSVIPFKADYKVASCWGDMTKD